MLTVNYRQTHGGDLRAVAGLVGVDYRALLDFSVNTNPFGPPAAVLDLLKAPRPDVTRYPELQAESLLAALADHLGITPGGLFAGNGSAELLYWLCARLKPAHVLTLGPSFADYRRAAEGAGAKVSEVILDVENDFAFERRRVDEALGDVDLAVIGRPNNPTGTLIDRNALRETIVAHGRTVWLIDEAFIDFTDDGESLIDVVNDHKNLLILRSLTKIYAIPDVRLGYLVGQPALIAELAPARAPWPLSQDQIEIGKAALSEPGFAASSRLRLAEERARLFEGLRAMPGLRPYPGAANFILIRIENDFLTGTKLLLALARHGILIRDCASFTGLGQNHIRVAVKDRDANQTLLSKLKECIDEECI